MMKKHEKYWKEGEIEFLKRNYKILSVKEIAEKLKRTINSVSRMKSRLKIRKTKDRTKDKICECGKRKQSNSKRCIDCWRKLEKHTSEKQKEAVRKANSGEKSHLWRGGISKQKKKCLYCGKIFQIIPGNINKYCSVKCGSLANAKTGGKNYFWKGGEINWKKRRYLYSSTEWVKLRKEILEENKTCATCGRNEGLHIHHKIKYKDGGKNVRENLIVLCKFCHSKLHAIESFYRNNHCRKSFEQLFNEVKRKVKQW